MSYTKRQFIEAALSEIGITSYTYDIQAGQYEDGARKLDAMMADWAGRGVALGYPLPNSPEDTDIDSETGVMDSANQAIIASLAVRLAPSYGRQVMVHTMSDAQRGFNMLLQKAVTIKPYQPSGDMPAGAGNRPLGQTYLDQPAATDALDGFPH